MQTYATVPLILKAEVYENAGGGRRMTMAAPRRDRQQRHEQRRCTGRSSHAHEEEAWAPADGFERFAFNVGGQRRHRHRLCADPGRRFGIRAGGIGNWRQGLFWGFAGFAVFTLAPGLGLPPELPAMPAADLGARPDLVDRRRWSPPRPVSALIAFRGTVPLSLVGWR